MKETLLVVPKKYHWPFLATYGATMLLLTMQTGYCLGGSSFVQSIFSAQTQWSTEDQTFITSSSTLGLAVGSLSSSLILSKGRRKTVLIGNLIILASYALQLVINVYLLALGKFVQGVGSGMILSAASIMVPETVPTKLVSGFGSLINLGVVMGLSLYQFLGLLVPKDLEDLQTTQIWRYMFAIPACTAVLLIILFMVVFKQDTISFMLVKNDQKNALTLIKRIYKRTTDDVHELILRQYTEASQSEPQVQPGIKSVLTDPEYRTATWLGIYLAVSVQLTGITALSIYSTQIFAILDENGLQMSPSTGSFYCGIAALIGSFVSMVTSVYFSFRFIFVGGYLTMALLTAGLIIGLQTDQNTLILGCFFPYFFVFNVTIGCSLYSYIGRTSEAAGLSVANMMLWGTSLLLALTTQTLFDLVKPTGAFLLFGINCVIAGVFCLLYLKEITGLTSEQAKSVYKPDHSLKSNKRADINVSIITSYEGNSFVAKNV